ncbi:hypothetical protein E2562_029878 [Oryza meyeriana var. granulata]|uniref:Uncharacterized protein n=1 Tax=Oryza meyeriana var. granulata TaxID=110450 RepID=A0A6G1CUF1_9ORYZ|nr:hypothetical protein E2562_029878 [Oryza meyeriana var. granulata]
MDPASVISKIGRRRATPVCCFALGRTSAKRSGHQGLQFGYRFGLPNKLGWRNDEDDGDGIGYNFS